MIDHIIDIDHKALKFTMSNERTSGIAAFDMKTAFPAPCRACIFWVLATIGLPMFLINAIAKLYGNRGTATPSKNSARAAREKLELKEPMLTFKKPMPEIVGIGSNEP